MKKLKISIAFILLGAIALGGAMGFVGAIAPPEGFSVESTDGYAGDIQIEGKNPFDNLDSPEEIITPPSNTPEQEEKNDAIAPPSVGGDMLEENADDGNKDTESKFPSETNAFVKDYLIGATDQGSPFFEKIMPQIAANIKENNTHSVTKYYDALPLANNPENFQGLSSSRYENINGKTVTAESFYRVYGDSLHDPNCGMGLLLYQCIQYKLKHPDEDVKVTFSSYRTSVTASVCVIPDSKYYGYMRSLYGTNYDEQGFVRISYMLVEAARMGIEVTMINHLPSYGTKQYDPESDKTKTRNHINYKKYFNAALATECYNSYVGEGKKVSDYLNIVNVDWTIDDQHINMHHLKSFSASHYLATDGTEHTSAVFFCSANLDENDYLGRNGNTYSQSGVIISDHDEIYRVHYNYNMLLTRLGHREGMQELRMIMADRNNEQIELLRSGRGNEIPTDEQIVYLGTENDPVFELYFAPLGGGVDAWNEEFNPICKYISKLPQSTGYIEYANVQYGYGRSYMGYIMERMLEQAFCNNPNPENKITIRINDFDTKAIQKLEVGSEIGYRYITDSKRMHAKDYLISYEEDGKRHYVSIMTSCNLYMMAFNYRSNSILVIHETEETGNSFYTGFGEKFTSGMISADETAD